MVCSVSRTFPGQGYPRKAFKTSEDIASIVFLNVTTTLMLHATLFLFNHTSLYGAQSAVSVHIHYLKWKCYSSKHTGHGFCLSIGQHSTLVEGRIGVSGVFIRQDTGGIWRQMRVSQRSAQYFFAMGHAPATVNNNFFT